MDYLDLLNDVVNNDFIIDDFMDKSLEKYMDSNNLNDPTIFKIKAYKTTDELDDVNTMKANGYILRKIYTYLDLHLAVAIFENPKNINDINWGK